MIEFDPGHNLGDLMKVFEVLNKTNPTYQRKIISELSWKGMFGHNDELARGPAALNLCNSFLDILLYHRSEICRAVKVVIDELGHDNIANLKSS